jgi:hypothetical protein
MNEEIDRLRELVQSLTKERDTAKEHIRIVRDALHVATLAAPCACAVCIVVKAALSL